MPIKLAWDANAICYEEERGRKRIVVLELLIVSFGQILCLCSGTQAAVISINTRLQEFDCLDYVMDLQFISLLCSDQHTADMNEPFMSSA